MKLKTLLVTIQKVAKAKSPQILVAIGIGGFVTSTILAVRKTPKAVRLMEEEKRRQGVEKLKPVDTIKVTWRCYAPSLMIFSLSTACVLGGQHISTRRMTALATAYSISEATLKEYKDKVVETIGEKKEKDIRDQIDKDRVERNPVSAKDVIITGHGEQLCYDAHTGRYFKGSIEKIRRVVQELNNELLTQDYVSLNEFYYKVGLENVKVGDALGWNSIDIPTIGEIGVDFSSQIARGDYEGIPCLVVTLSPAPRYDYTTLL